MPPAPVRVVSYSGSYTLANIDSKARWQIGLKCRIFCKFTTSAILLKLYKSTVRPLLEYACVDHF